MRFLGIMFGLAIVAFAVLYGMHQLGLHDARVAQQAFEVGYRKGFDTGHTNGWIAAVRPMLPPPPVGLSEDAQSRALVRLYERWKSGDWEAPKYVPSECELTLPDPADLPTLGGE